MRNQNHYRVHKARVLATSQAAAVDITIILEATTVIRLVCSQDSWVVVGPSPAPAIGTGVFMPANSVEYFTAGNNDKVGAITNTAASGIINITEMTQ